MYFISQFEYEMDTRPGTYKFKFIVDGEWKANSDYQIDQNDQNHNNFITIE
jgi:hypothetical protein